MKKFDLNGWLIQQRVKWYVWQVDQIIKKRKIKHIRIMKPNGKIKMLKIKQKN